MNLIKISFRKKNLIPIKIFFSQINNKKPANNNTSANQKSGSERELGQRDGSNVKDHEFFADEPKVSKKIRSGQTPSMNKDRYLEDEENKDYYKYTDYIMGEKGQKTTPQGWVTDDFHQMGKANANNRAQKQPKY